MKLRLAPSNLATRLHRPLRFGSRWRGHELPLRLCQLILLALLAVTVARLVGQGIARILAG
ncbi:hypothetical protein ACI48D_25590 [Massilia sp. LXY-6]|uniref:hypothetical protein n=1 Tax=Massilia sp. LXY-6 TaxID=3379823 RepID=UPI003EE3454C